MEDNHALRFPVGESPRVKEMQAFDAMRVRADVAEIKALPALLAAVVKRADRGRLHNTYRENGWTAAQVIHHIADSHINSWCRFRFALTEDNPTIKPYDEAAWARLPDYDVGLVDTTIALIAALHSKWAYFLERLGESEWHRTFYHPGNREQVALFQGAAIYAWHGRHHLKHVEMALGRAA
jgi:hypothetical protein